MTETAGKELSPEWYAIDHAAEKQRNVLYTPSVLEAAATALTDALAALSPHSITGPLMETDHPFAARILHARSSRRPGGRGPLAPLMEDRQAGDLSGVSLGRIIAPGRRSWSSGQEGE